MTNDQDPRSRRPPSVFKVIGFMIVCLPLRIAAFVPVVVLLVAGVYTTMIWVGIPLLLAATGLLRVFTGLERSLARTMLHAHIQAPQRLRPTGSGLRRAWHARLVDTATWRDLRYVLIALPIGILEFAAGIASIVMPPLAIWVVPRIGTMHGKLASSMLGPDRAQWLEGARARGAHAVEAERRRIERDLHDGAQQRLVALAMSLGIAKSKLESAPDAVRTLVDAAHSDAKLAVSELRDLARGIYPALLSDRGLGAALSAQAAKTPIPVDVEVTVDPRPPTAVETTAYFIVGETLTNITKHSGASRAGVRVWQSGNLVIVEITDDGHGGAEIRAGGGLAGLADRAATIDGTLTVISPRGGPTVVRAELPCQW